MNGQSYMIKMNLKSAKLSYNCHTMHSKQTKFGKKKKQLKSNNELHVSNPSTIDSDSESI